MSETDCTSDMNLYTNSEMMSKLIFGFMSKSAVPSVHRIRWQCWGKWMCLTCEINCQDRILSTTGFNLMTQWSWHCSHGVSVYFLYIGYLKMLTFINWQGGWSGGPLSVQLIKISIYISDESVSVLVCHSFSCPDRWAYDFDFWHYNSSQLFETWSQYTRSLAK